MTLVAILVATLIAGIGSVWLAAALGLGPLARYTQHLLSLAAGALLATAFMHLLPEAFESGIEPKRLFAVLLVGLVFFFLLDKAELWHHGHEHAHETQAHGSSEGGRSNDHARRAQPLHHHRSAGIHDHAAPIGSGGWAVLAGDSVHCFGDGVLIASAFVADLRLGALTALAVLAHEVPHHMGDLVVVGRRGGARSGAVTKVSLAGAVTAVGGIAGYFLVDRIGGGLPYFLVVASSSFVYVALADLIPQLQKRLSATETATQVGWLLAGIALVTVVSGTVHHPLH